MYTPHISSVLSVCLLFLCTKCQIQQERDSNVTWQQGNTCMPGYFGRGCAGKCPAPCPKACDIQGHCTVCSRPGVQLPNCTVECATGFYGLHCKNTCPECKDSACDPVSGECRHCRFPGLRLPFCTKWCLPGTFGMDCKGRCSLACGQDCDLVTGNCLKCHHGQGPQCLVNCASEENLEACKRYCLGRCLTWCNSSSGMCAVCAPGYKLPYCKDPCGEGRFGHNCAEKCSSRCKAELCDPATGVCYACSDGYVGERCNGQCIPGFYGAGCVNSCPPTCADGLCNFATGDCTRCYPGYTGPGCDELCGDGHFGDGCKLDCPDTCGGTCDPVSGECWRCLPGYVGIFCNESCKHGTFGSACASLCPAGCLQHSCDHVTGACIACEENLRGDLCDQSDVTASTPVSLLIIVSLLMTAVVVTLLIASWCFWGKLRSNQREHTGTQPESHPQEEAAVVYNTNDKQQTPTTTKRESPMSASRRPARDPSPSVSMGFQHVRMAGQPGHLFKPRRHKLSTSLVTDRQAFYLRPGLRCSKELAPQERDSQAIDKQLTRILKHPPQGFTAHPFPSKEIRLLKKESVMDLSKLGRLSRRGEQDSVSSEGRLGSMRGESSATTSSKHEYRSDGKSARETKITLYEQTECLSGKTTVSTAWSVNMPPYTPLPPSRHTPEMVIAPSRDSCLSGRILSSADSLFGLTSADLSHQVSSLSHRNNKLLEKEQHSPAKNKPPRWLTSNIRASTSHVFSDTTAAPHKTALLRSLPSAHSLPGSIHSTQLTCCTRPGAVGSDVSSTVCSDGRLAVTTIDLKTRRTHFVTEHEISINDQQVRDVGKPGASSEAARVSCTSQRSVVVSDSPKSARRPYQGTRPGPSDSQAGQDTYFYSSLSKVDRTGQREQNHVAGDETIPHSETNSWLNYDDPDDSAACDASLHTKVRDSSSREAVHTDLTREVLEQTRSSVGASSYHRVPNINPNITPPKQLVKPDVSVDEDSHNETSDALLFQTQSEKVTIMQCTDQETVTDKPVQTQDDLFVHSIPSRTAVSSKRAARPRLPGESASPKLIRCSTTRQVSPMYSHNTSQPANRLQPLPTPPPEGIKVLRPVRNQSMSSSSSESQLPDQDLAK
ncbi:hypothetical protein BsWGS_00053 [Bradybaena similaris]